MKKIQIVPHMNITEQPKLNEFKNCVGKIIHYKKNVGKFEARNP